MGNTQQIFFSRVCKVPAKWIQTQLVWCNIKVCDTASNSKVMIRVKAKLIFLFLSMQGFPWEESSFSWNASKDITPYRGCLVRGGSEEVVIVPFGTRELVSKFYGVWMLLESVVWKILCLFWCLDGVEKWYRKSVFSFPVIAWKSEMESVFSFSVFGLRSGK